MRPFTLLLLVLSVPACSTTSEPPASDGGIDATTSVVDAAHGPDAIVLDVGHPIDAFAAPDALAAPDAFAPADAGHDAAVGHDAALDAGSTGCPPNPPTNGAACAPSDLACTYGEDPRVSCRIHATCNHGTWLVTPPPPCSAPPTCPDTEPSAGTTCDTRGASCGYAADTCLCYSCSIPCSLPDSWHCSARAAGCPATTPNLGTACTGTETCDYGNCVGGTAVQCTGGIWVQHFTACPG